MKTLLNAVVLASAAQAIDLVSLLQASDFVQPEFDSPLDYFEAADVVHAKHRINDAYDVAW